MKRILADFGLNIAVTARTPGKARGSGSRNPVLAGGVTKLFSLKMCATVCPQGAAGLRADCGNGFSNTFQCPIRPEGTAGEKRQTTIF